MSGTTSENNVTIGLEHEMVRAEKTASLRDLSKAKDSFVRVSL